jgi:hypothetical protein
MKQISFSADTIAQMSHVGWGIVIVLGLHFVGGMNVWYAGAILFAFAAIKEGIMDVFFEDTETRGNGWEDFAFWIAGGIAGVLIALV